MKSPLTSKQQALFSFLKDQINAHESAPTLEEMRSFTGVKSLNTIAHHLKALEQKGYISRNKHAQRSIEILSNVNNSFATMVSVPVTGSVGCDDLSVFANEEHDEFIQVDEDILKPSFKYVAVRAIGNSMNDAGISDGDYVLIQITEDVESGDRVVAVVEGMVTVKKLERRDGLTMLLPESTDPKYKPIVLKGDFKITGKVVSVIPNNKRLVEVIPHGEEAAPHGPFIDF